MSESVKKLIKPVIAFAAIAGVLAWAYLSGGDVKADRASVPESSGSETVTSVPDEIPSVSTVTSISETAPAVTESISQTVTEVISSETVTEISSTEKATETEEPKTTTVTTTASSVTTTSVAKQTEPEPKGHTCSFMISCATVFDNTDLLRAGIIDVLPKDGMIFPKAEVPFEEGDTVFDLISRICEKNGIAFEYSRIALTSNKYIEGIGGLYEFDAGNLSGWMYSVNGKFPQMSSSQISVSDGDVIEFVYSCNIGVDVGDDFYSKAG